MNSDEYVRRIECDSIETKMLVLKDKKGNERASLFCKEAADGKGGFTVFHFYDEHGTPKISLQVDDTGDPSISLFNPNNSPGTSITLSDEGNGITVTSVDGKPLIAIMVHGPSSERIDSTSEIIVSDLGQNKSWSVRDGEISED